MVAESLRYQRRAMAVRDAVASGRIGQVLSGRINFIPRGRHTYSYPGRRAWLADVAAGGSGIWMLNGIHQMSAARMFLGEVTRIYAREVHSAKFESPLEATVVALVTFDSGAEITMTVSAELHGYHRFGDLLLHGSEGTLHVERRNGGRLLLFTESDEPEVIGEWGADDQRGGAPGHFVRQMAEFLGAVAEGREPATSGPCERATLAAILAGYASIRTGRPVVPAGAAATGPGPAANRDAPE
jgi:predicted dehydrogenase